MTQAITRAPDKLLTLEMVSEMTGYSPAEIALISHTVAQGAPLQELAAFLYACRATGLNPLLRQAYWIRRGNPPKGALQVGIDGFRSIADASGAYAGSEPPIFRGVAKLGKDRNVPERASVTVWRIVSGHKSAFTGEAYWAEFYPGDGADGAMWRKMPHRMLSKAAEAEALRKGFPAQLSSVRMSAEVGEDEMREGPAAVWERTDAQPAAPQPRRSRAENAAEYDRIYGEDAPERPVAQSPGLPEPELDESEAGTSDEEQAAVVNEQQQLSDAWRMCRELDADAAALKIRVAVLRNTSTLEQVLAHNDQTARLIREASQ